MNGPVRQQLASPCLLTPAGETDGAGNKWRLRHHFWHTPSPAALSTRPFHFPTNTPQESRVHLPAQAPTAPLCLPGLPWWYSKVSEVSIQTHKGLNFGCTAGAGNSHEGRAYQSYSPLIVGFPTPQHQILLWERKREKEGDLLHLSPPQHCPTLSWPHLCRAPSPG